VNRSDQEAATLHVTISDSASYRVVEHVVLGGEDLDNTNNQSAPTRVTTRANAAHEIIEHELTVTLPPASWTMLRAGRT
jgi:alpha-N-arabinofuranosidase